MVYLCSVNAVASWRFGTCSFSNIISCCMVNNWTSLDLKTSIITVQLTADLEADYQEWTCREKVKWARMWRHKAALHKTNQQTLGCSKRRKVQPSKSHWRRSHVSLWIDLPLLYTASFLSSHGKLWLTHIEIWFVSLCMYYGNHQMWKNKYSPEHVSCTKHHIKLPAVKACSFLCHLRRFQQPRLFQQKLTWWGGENSSTVETLRDPHRGAEGYTICKCWIWPR